jgi:hypothetical protein
MKNKPFVLALAVYGVFAGSDLPATMYLQDGFASSVYTVGDDGMGMIDGKGDSETGFNAEWDSAGSSVVRCFSTGLSFPASWEGYSAAGDGSIGYKNTNVSANGTVGSNDSNYRAGQREIASSAFPSEGTFYLRALVSQGSGAGVATRVEGMARGVGLRTCGLLKLSSGSPMHGRAESGNALTNGVWFAFRKVSSSSSKVDTEVVFCFGGESQTLVSSTAFTEGTTYLCLAEITVGEQVAKARAFAMPVDDFDGMPALHWGEQLQTSAISSSAPFTHLCMTGPYMTANAVVCFDEIAAASTTAELVPTKTVFPYISSLHPELNGFSVPVVLNLEGDVNADVEVEYGTDEDSLSGSVKVLENKPTGHYNVAVDGLEPDMAYYWRLSAKTNGAVAAQSPVFSVRTLGAPELASPAAEVVEGGINFSVELAVPALYGAPEQPETTVSVVYVFGSVTNEVALGSLAEPGVLSPQKVGASWGQTYKYWFKASATYADRTFSCTTEESTVSVRSGSDVYVSSSGSNTSPYDTPEKAAHSVADAVAVAGNGATVFVAAGTYETTSRIAIGSAVRVEGMTGRPEDVVVRNVGDSTSSRVFNLTHAGAVLANVTVSGGIVRNYTGGNIWMTGGLVTNCIVQNATLSWSTADTNNEHGGGGVYMRGGKLVNCIIRGNTVTGTAVKDQATGIYANGSSVIQNCLVAENNSELEAAVVYLAENAHLVNCTVVKSTLGSGTGLNGGSASIRIGSNNAYVQNCAVAGIVDVNNVTLRPLDGTGGTTTHYDHIANSAFDFELGETLAEKKCVSATPAAMFSNYAGGRYKPSSNGPLVDAAKAEVTDALPSLDLAGRARLRGNGYDIGCYECQNDGLAIILR